MEERLVNRSLVYARARLRGAGSGLLFLGIIRQIMPSFARGERLGPYEILEAIGAGGMGEVWKARDTRLDRVVAIKVSKEQFSERFEREARAVAALNHPHICQLYDVGPNYLVMEFIEGTPLRGPLPLAQAVEYAGQILEALDAAHRKGITHRDLKPANILVTKQGIKLLDFGLAKQTGTLPAAGDATLTRALTQQGEILGTLQYMAPEQLQGKETDARSDLFSFGCVLYEMLTGKRAFEGPSAASVIAAILEREPAPLTTAPPLERVVRRSLAKDPDQRFQTARDLKAALAWAMEQPPPSAATKPSRRWWWIAAAVLVIGVLLGGWAVAHFRQPPADDRAFRLQIDPPEGGQFVVSGNGVGGLALSPDGRTAAFIASGNGRTGLWVRPLDGTTARLIAGTEGAFYPFWSPDSKSIAFFTRGQLKRVDPAGGAPIAICNVPLLARGGAWSSDGQIIFGTTASGLLRVPASGGTPAPLTMIDASRGERTQRFPQVLPNGHLIFLLQSEKPENTGVYAASLSKPGERVKLLATDTNAVYAPGANGKGYLLWLRGGALVAQEFNPGTLKFAGEPHAVADTVAANGSLGQMNAATSAGGVLLYGAYNNSSQFTWLDRAGKPMGVVGEPGEYTFFRLSPDGLSIVASRSNPGGSNDLWRLEVKRGVAGRLTFNSGFNIYPIWSPDGRAIVFEDATRNLFRKESSGAGSEERLTQSPNIQLPNDWSRDGRFVLYHENSPDTGLDLWVLPVTPEGKPAPGAQPRPYLRTPFNERLGRFSPEAPPHWVAYESDETGRDEVYIAAFPEPRGKFRISTDGGQYPQWGAGGRELFYVSLDNKLMAVSLKLGGDSVEPSAPHELFPLPAVDTGWSPYDATADGQRFLVRATPSQAGQPLTVIVNWPALLKKETPAP
jgi:Tol biopolymer transport system component/predicted Ser/Thr protein kinase